MSLRKLMIGALAAGVAASGLTAVAFAGEGMTAAMIEQIMAAAESESAQALNRARQRFTQEIKSASVIESRVPPATVEPSAYLVVAPGREDELMAERGRLADLIVVARSAPNDEAISSLTLDACLRDTGRLVLVMPDVAPEFGRHVASRPAHGRFGVTDPCGSAASWNRNPPRRVVVGLIMYSAP